MLFIVSMQVFIHVIFTAVAKFNTLTGLVHCSCQKFLDVSRISKKALLVLSKAMVQPQVK